MPVEIIAEIAQAHDGSLGILHSFIDVAADAGADVVKFQMHIAEAESSPHEPFRKPFSYEDATRYDYWRRMEFTREQWVEIRNHCEARGVEFLVTPFSMQALQELVRLNVNRYKVGSGEVTNSLMLDALAELGKPVILSTGLCSDRELDSAVCALQRGVSPVTLLHCVSEYPTDACNCNLPRLDYLKDRYKLPVGLSDHSGTIYPGLAAVAMGATIIEVHLTFDRNMFGPDASSSVTVAELKTLVQGVRFLEQACSASIARHNNREMRSIFGKSLAVNKDLPVGHKITREDLEGKKPLGRGIASADYAGVVGLRLKRNIQRWEFLNWEDVH